MTLYEFVEKRPHLAWYEKDLTKLSEDSIVEHVLNYGNWKDVQMLIKIIGILKVAEIFRRKSKPDKFGRQNYRPEIKHYFQLYFNRHVPPV